EWAVPPYGAAGWADLAVTLRWRLPGTAAALSEGVIDVYRARLIAEATSLLSDQAARAVEERVLPAAGGQTPGMLRAALRRAVITAGLDDDSHGSTDDDSHGSTDDDSHGSTDDDGHGNPARGGHRDRASPDSGTADRGP